MSYVRVAVKEIGSKELPSRSFVVETHVKEIISPEAVKRMFERDFNEGKHVAQQTLSMDDRRFMTKVKERITHRSDGHYELPLPLRNESLALPNNEKLAVHRLQQLKLRFRRHEKYKEDYTAFMNDMIQNVRSRWLKWRVELHHLEDLSVCRSFKPGF